jgi:hypothetical protein
MEKVTQADLSYASRFELRSRETSLNYHQHLFTNLFFINMHVSVCNTRKILSLCNGKLCQPQYMHEIFHCTPVYNTGLVNDFYYADILIN